VLFTEEALRFVRVKPGQRVLGVGTGTALVVIAAEAGAEVLAVDFSQGMVGHVKSKIRQRGMRNIRAAVMYGQALDAEDSSFNAVLSIRAATQVASSIHLPRTS
jgi:cyclopropane fatty-acyl-phospholipid synthase-like methyltransferase